MVGPDDLLRFMPIWVVQCLFLKGNRKFMAKVACKDLGIKMLETETQNSLKSHTYTCSAVLVHMNPEGESRF